jgi:hypothetical protein
VEKRMYIPPAYAEILDAALLHDFIHCTEVIKKNKKPATCRVFYL